MARSFNGSSDEIDCGNAFNPTNNQAIAICAWVNLTALPATAATFGIAGRGYDGKTSLEFSIAGPTAAVPGPRVGSYNGANFITANWAAYNWNAGEWHHLYGEYTGTIWNLYADGIKQGTTTNGQGPLANTAHNTIGANWSSGTFNSFANAKIAEVGIINGNLHPEEISAIVRGVRLYTIRPQMLVCYWPLDGLASPEPDLSKNHNNGTLTGTTLATSGPPMTLFTPLWPVNELPTSAVTSVFRKTASRIGTRVGTRQTWAA